MAGLSGMRSKQSRIGAALVACLIVLGVAVGIVLLTSSGDAPRGPTTVPIVSESPSTGPTEVIVCESAIDEHGGVSTGSSVAKRVPVGSPIPAGCHRA